MKRKKNIVKASQVYSRAVKRQREKQDTDRIRSKKYGQYIHAAQTSPDIKKAGENLRKAVRLYEMQENEQQIVSRNLQTAYEVLKAEKAASKVAVSAVKSMADCCERAIRTSRVLLSDKEKDHSIKSYQISYYHYYKARHEQRRSEKRIRYYQRQKKKEPEKVLADKWKVKAEEEKTGILNPIKDRQKVIRKSMAYKRQTSAVKRLRSSSLNIIKGYSEAAKELPVKSAVLLTDDLKIERMIENEAVFAAKSVIKIMISFFKMFFLALKSIMLLLSPVMLIVVFLFFMFYIIFFSPLSGQFGADFLY